MEIAFAEWLVAVSRMTPRMRSLSARASSSRFRITVPIPSPRQSIATC